MMKKVDHIENCVFCIVLYLSRCSLWYIIGFLVLFNLNYLKSQDHKYIVGVYSGPLAWGGAGKLDNQDSYGRVSACFGTFLESRQNKFISLNTGLLYELKGLDGIPNSMISNYIPQTIFEPLYFTQIEYLTLPFLIKLNLGKRVKFHLNLGPYISYKLNQSIYVFQKWEMENLVTDVSYINNFDYGIMYGLGTSYKIRKNFAIGCDIRQSNGLVNISNLDLVGYKNPRINTICLFVGMSYSFNTRYSSY
jgi:hypothetical protein